MVIPIVRSPADLSDFLRIAKHSKYSLNIIGFQFPASNTRQNFYSQDAIIWKYPVEAIQIYLSAISAKSFKFLSQLDSENFLDVSEA